MTVMYKQPGLPAKMVNIRGSLKDLQTLVGGYIESISLNCGNSVCHDIVCLCDEDGRAKGLRKNIRLGNIPYDILGNVVFLGARYEYFESLTKEECALISEVYA